MRARLSRARRHQIVALSRFTATPASVAVRGRARTCQALDSPRHLRHPRGHTEVPPPGTLVYTRPRSHVLPACQLRPGSLTSTALPGRRHGFQVLAALPVATGGSTDLPTCPPISLALYYLTSAAPAPAPARAGTLSQTVGCCRWHRDGGLRPHTAPSDPVRGPPSGGNLASARQPEGHPAVLTLPKGEAGTQRDPYEFCLAHGTAETAPDGPGDQFVVIHARPALPTPPGSAHARPLITRQVTHRGQRDAALTRPHGLHQDDTIPADGEAEAMLVLLDDDTALNKT